MVETESVEQGNSKQWLTIFGQPIIATPCYRNAWILGISGGIVGGLVGFLFTSSPRKATNIGFGSFGIITVSMQCYCAYEEYMCYKNGRAIKKALYQARLLKGAPSINAETQDA